MIYKNSPHFTRGLRLLMILLVFGLVACTNNSKTSVPAEPDESPLFTSADLGKAVPVKHLAYTTIEGLSLYKEAEALELPYVEVDDLENELTAQAVLPDVQGWLVVYRVNMDGIYQVRLYDQTNDSGVTVYAGLDAVQSVAVDGSGTLVVASILDDATGNHDVHLFDIAANTNFNLTATSARDEIDVSISEDGSRIVYGREHSSGKLRPYVCDYNGNPNNPSCNISTLSNFRDQYQPSISANGRYLAMIEERPNSRYRVRVYDFATNTYTDVQTRSDVLEHPSVDNSGQQVMFVRNRDISGTFSIRLKDLVANTIRSTINDTVALDHPHITGPANHFVYGVFSPSSNTRKARTRDLMTNNFATPQGGAWNYFSPFWTWTDDPGSLETSLGDGGYTTTDISGDWDEAYAVIHDSSGRIILGGVTNRSSTNVTDGDFALVRYDEYGLLDMSFGTNGKVTTDFVGKRDIIYDLAIDASGKIIAVGLAFGSSGQWGIARYNPDGTLDTSFGSGGKFMLDFSSAGIDSAQAVKIDANGKIVVAGYGGGGSSGFDFVTVRLNTNGVLDTSFGTNGIVRTGIGSGSLSDRAYALSIDAGGKIVVGGTGFKSNFDFALVRYNSDGSLDSSFGTSGVVTTPIGSGHDYIYALMHDSNGKIMAVGYADGGATDFDVALARYNSDGSLDSSFGTAGKVIDALTGTNDVVYDAVFDASENIVVVVHSLNDELARYNADGSRDTSFGTNGLVEIDIPPCEIRDLSYAVDIDAKGKIITAGYCDVPPNGSNRHFLASRFNP